MPLYNVLLGCDQKYYDDWAKPLLESIYKNNPYLNLHCHIVNPTRNNKLPYVDITSEKRRFTNSAEKISYLQSVRFLVAADKFSNNENVFTLDCDSICTGGFHKEDVKRLFEKQHVLKHHKINRWLAGFVVFNQNGFRQEFSKELRSLPYDQWEWGRDQTVLNTFADEFHFEPVGRFWMSIGKLHREQKSAFLTLKGEQKFSEKYLKHYNRF